MDGGWAILMRRHKAWKPLRWPIAQAVLPLAPPSRHCAHLTRRLPLKGSDDRYFLSGRGRSSSPGSVVEKDPPSCQLPSITRRPGGLGTCRANSIAINQTQHQQYHQNTSAPAYLPPSDPSCGSPFSVDPRNRQLRRTSALTCPTSQHRSDKDQLTHPRLIDSKLST